MLGLVVPDGAAYQVVLVLHLMTVIIGFGSVFLNGVYGLQAKARGGREGLAIAESLYTVSTKWSEWFIYAVPLLGIVLVLLSDDRWQFSQAWISLSLLLYIVAIGIVHGAHLPNIRKMNATMADMVAAGPPAAGSGPPPQVTELEQRGKRAAALGGVLNLLVIVLVVLMVFKPGA